MKDVYVVVAFDHGTDMDVCEFYDDLSSAYNKAYATAFFKSVHDKSQLIEKPSATSFFEGNKWIFLKNNFSYVAVLHRKIFEKNNITLDGLRNPLPVPKQVPLLNLDDLAIIQEEDNSPAGWSYSDKPVTMKYLREYPKEIKPYFMELTEPQKWALVTARIKANPNYKLASVIYGTMNQSEALRELKSYTKCAQEIRNKELEYLEFLRTDGLKPVENI